MKYSIILPVYNCARTLPDCIRSISALTCGDWELLLIDDGSTDGSGELCRRFAETDSRIRCISQENLGVSAARNRGIRESKGQWILFADGDDIIEPKALSKLLSREMTGDLVIFGHSFDFYSRGICYQRQSRCWRRTETLSSPDWGRELENLYRCNGLSPVWNKIFSRKILEENRLSFRESMFQYEDLDFTLRYLACCKQIFLYAPAAYRYHLREEGKKTRKRIGKIPDIPEFLAPLEDDLLALAGKNPAVTDKSIQNILLHLYLHLAKETAANADLRTLRRLSLEFGRWCQERCIFQMPDRFSSRLLSGRTVALRISVPVGKLRHAVAVAYKRRLRREDQCHHSGF